MGFSAQKYRREGEARKWRVHPVWRGIGCVLILMIPIMAWVAAQVVIQSGVKLPIPYNMTKPLVINYVHVTEVDRAIKAINTYTADNNLTSEQFLLTVILMVVGFGLLSVIYAIFYSMAGPPRYGPFDIPPDMMRR